jgi:hypothetical protein
MGLTPGCEGVNSTERKGDGFNTGGGVRGSILQSEKAMGLIPGGHTPTADRRHPTSPLPTANSVGANPVGTNP